MTPDTSPTVLAGKSDAFLVDRARAGCDVAFAEIVARYRPSLLRHCSRYLSRPRGEDAVQQTFIRAMQWLRTGADVRELRPWLYAIARNVALNELKKSGWDYDELPEGWEDRSGNDEVEHRAAVRETLGAVASLPDRQRRALLRSAVDGYSPAAIANELGVSEGAVRQLVHRARVSVRAAVGAVLPAPLAWLARRVGAGAARVAGTSPAAAPLAPKLAAVVVAAITTGIPLAAIVHQASVHTTRARLTAAVYPERSSTARANVRAAPGTPGGGAGSGAGPAGVSAHAGPRFIPWWPRPVATPHPKKVAPAASASSANPTATQAGSDQPASDPGSNPSCDPSTDPTCGGSTGTSSGCDPSTDPTCGGGSTGTSSGCDPSTDPTCGGGSTGTSSGCDPSTDPTCGAGSTGTSSGCDPSTDPSCGSSTATAASSASSDTTASGGSSSTTAGGGSSSTTAGGGSGNPTPSASSSGG